ncbi:MAG TPA: glutaminase A [Saprospiraceae bacterium]|mgnify:CR=1 FL=1|nr:glutaminase A [Saprospiraceae bacterium]HMP24157.1 glutaminase A [Saprospiraceae bacterium]
MSNHSSLPEIYDDDAALNVAPLFDIMDKEGKGVIPADLFFNYLSREGILRDDLRLQNALNEFEVVQPQHDVYNMISLIEMERMVRHNTLVKNALTKNLIVPDFDDFCRDIQDIYDITANNTSGAVADYIPQLARVNPEQFAVSICTIDGQRFSVGDAYTSFGLQSTCKPINYCLALQEHGVDTVHRHVGREPSGRTFNELSLNNVGLPHNPLINAGAIMSCSLLRPQMNIADRFDYVFNTWRKLCAYKNVSFNNSVYLSERQTADRNFALAYFMRENKAFPEGINLTEVLEFYFQCCSIESCSHHLAIAAATLANAGVNPLSGEKLFDEEVVQHCLSLMLSCGMYDFSGEFAFRIGVPAKSGVSGALFVVIPNLMGISIWSPRLDKHGNSVRGVEFCERLIEKYAFHNYDSLTRETSKKNPRKHKYERRINQIVNLIYAASYGDLDEIKRLEALGMDLGSADYDGRTALHLAAAENQVEIVRYLLSRNIPDSPIDRWGGTPLDDAKKAKHQDVIALFEHKRLAPHYGK